MPTRTLKETICTSRTLAKLSHGAERLFGRLIVVADDYGRFDGDPQAIRARCFQVMLDTIKDRHVEGWLRELVEAPLIRLYCVGARQYGVFVNADEHFNRRAKHSKYPEPPDPSTSVYGCLQPCTDVPEVRGTRSEGRGSRVEVRGTRYEDTTPPASPDGDPAADSLTESWGTPQSLVALYNLLAPDELPRVTTLSDARRKKARAYLTQFPEREFWSRCFSELRFSRFLRGLNAKDGHAGFLGDFDWLLTKGKDGTENCVKASDGKYRDKEHR